MSSHVDSVSLLISSSEDNSIFKRFMLGTDLNGFWTDLNALTKLGAFVRTEFLCISVSIASGPRVKLYMYFCIKSSIGTQGEVG